MNVSGQLDVQNTRAKLKKLEERYAALHSRPTAPGGEKVREWTLLSLKKLMNQFQEEIKRSQAHSGKA